MFAVGDTIAVMENLGYSQLCHLEIQVTDLPRARAFYEAVFGWEFRAFFPGMDAFGFGDQHIGGLMVSEKVVPGESPSLWFKVKDIDESLAKVVAAGGAEKTGREEVPHVGWSATFTDLDGTTIGIVQYTG
jgi:uncharacterized protein